MILTKYSHSGPIKNMWKQNAVVGHDKHHNYIAPIIYLQRPKWIEDDEMWQKICDSVRIDLPEGTEIK